MATSPQIFLAGFGVVFQPVCRLPIRDDNIFARALSPTYSSSNGDFTTATQQCFPGSDGVSKVQRRQQALLRVRCGRVKEKDNVDFPKYMCVLLFLFL